MMKITRMLNAAALVTRVGWLSLALLLLLVQSAKAQSDNRNAAHWYGRAITNWQQFKATHPDKVNLLMEFAGDPSQPITPDVRAALAGIQGVFSDYRRGSQQEISDFALDHSQGFELLLPHLGEMRGIVRAMRVESAVRLADGDTNGAAAILGSLYRSASHFGDDRTLISTLVGQAVFSFADSGVQHALDHAQFNAGDAAALLSGLKRLDHDDPFQYVQALATEQEIALITLERYRGPEGAALLNDLLGGVAGNEQFFQRMAGMDDDAFDRAIAQYDAMMTKMNSVFAITDKDAAITEAKMLEEQMVAGEFGPLAQVLGPALTRILDRKFDGERMVRERIAMLEQLVTGQEQPEDIANAAVWYLRAIEMWESRPRNLRAMVLQPIDAADSVAHAQQREAALLDLQQIIDVVREASFKRRCDFAALVRYDDLLPIVPHYAPGMCDLIGLLHSDAHRLLAEGQSDQAIDRLACAIRVCSHLAGDAHLAVCRASHVLFNATMTIVERALGSGAIDMRAPGASSLNDATARIGRADPFGYVGSLQKTRDLLARRAPNAPRRGQPVPAEQVEIIRAYNADQAMFILILLDERARRVLANPHLHRGQAEHGGATVPGHPMTSAEMLERMRIVFDIDAVDAVRQDFDHLGPRLEQDDWAIFMGHPATPVASLAMGQTRARADLRRAARLLMPVASDAEPPADNDDAESP